MAVNSVRHGFLCNNGELDVDGTCTFVLYIYASLLQNLNIKIVGEMTVPKFWKRIIGIMHNWMDLMVYAVDVVL